MASAQQKPKSGKSRNDDRGNGKATKKKAGSRGSRKTKLDEGQKVMLGGGLLVKWDKANAKAKIESKARANKKPRRRQESDS